MIPVIIESPFAGCVPLNRSYLQACIRDCLRRGETPYASHQMLTDALDDTVAEERELGISAGLRMRDALQQLGATSAFYTDLGWSSGMKHAAGTVGMFDADERRILNVKEWERIVHEAAKCPIFRHALVGFWVDAPHGSVEYFSKLCQQARDVYLARRAA